MRPQTYLRPSLLLPYLLWIIVLALTQANGGSAHPTISDGTFPRLLALLPYIYVIGIIFCLVPYTLLALGLLLWSIQKQSKTVLFVFALSPFMLAVLMLVEINLLSIATQEVTYSLTNANVADLMALNQVVIFASLLVGYFCVAIGFATYKILRLLSIIREARIDMEPALKEAL